MKLVTINNIWLKCYLNICIMCKCDFTNIHIFEDKMRSSKTLAVALNKLNGVLFNKINKKIYSFFATLIMNSSSSAKIVQLILSFSDKFNALTTSEGIVVLKELECDALKEFKKEVFEE